MSQDAIVTIALVIGFLPAVCFGLLCLGMAGYYAVDWYRRRHSQGG